MPVLPYGPKLILHVGLQLLALLVASMCSPPARAQEAQTESTSSANKRGVVAAATAFTQGQQAELSGHYERAGELFELADRIAPTPEALRSATRNRLAAGQLASAASNAEELLRRYGDDAASRELAQRVLTRAKPELARLTLQCTAPCTAVVDGYATGTQALETQIVYVSPGPHDLSVQFDGEATRDLRVSVSAGESRSMRVARPVQVRTKALEPTEAPPKQEALGQTTSRKKSLSPTYFWVGAGATLAVGAVTLWSGLDLFKARDDFKASPNPTRAAFEDGESKDRRTTILVITTGALAVTTAALAAWTDFGFDKSERPRASLSVYRHAAQLTYGGRF